MPLAIDSRRVGEITVLTCVGRIVEGDESATLQRHVDALATEGPYIVLHLGGVEFIDSSGLGLLVRCLIRLESMHGIIRICCASEKMQEAFRVTGLNTLFRVYDSEATAIAEFYEEPPGKPGTLAGANVLCVEESPDLLAYVGQVLRQARYVVLTTTNLPDALTLLTATRPRVVVISEGLRSMRNTSAATTFNTQADALKVVTLPPGFSGRDAAAAGRDLLERVRTILG